MIARRCSFPTIPSSQRNLCARGLPRPGRGAPAFSSPRCHPEPTDRRFRPCRKGSASLCPISLLVNEICPVKGHAPKASALFLPGVTAQAAPISKLFRICTYEKNPRGVGVLLLTRHPTIEGSNPVGKGVSPERPTEARDLAYAYPTKALCSDPSSGARDLGSRLYPYFVTSLLHCFFLPASPLQSPRSIQEPSSPWGIDER